MPRRPIALSNWKMAMTVAEGLAFARELPPLAGELLDDIDVVICPPFTALWPIAQALRGSRLQLGGQNIAADGDAARTGEISAAQLAEAGCAWVLLGHWEVRRHLGDDDAVIGRKVRLALDAGLSPIVLVGEASDDDLPPAQAIERRLGRLLAGCQPHEVAGMALVYEPELAAGRQAPTAPEHVAAACAAIRERVRAGWGEHAAEELRLIYGGSVGPEHAADLLSSRDVDGLGAGRRGRDAATFAEIVRQIARAKLRYTT